MTPVSILIAVLLASLGALGAEERPNILYILADDVGREVLGCYGGESYETPRIDALAGEGMRFLHTYSMPVCHPSRIAILTGRYPVTLNHPKWGSFPAAEESHAAASLLRNAGYATAVAGKWQLCLMKKDRDQPHRMGFDEWSLFGWHEGPRYHDPLIYQNGELREDTAGTYGPDLYTDFLIDFMARDRKDQPFFAFYSMALCHDVTDDIGKPVPYGPDGHWLTYKEMAEDMDRQVGKLIDALDRLGLREDTLILFTTDNGTAAASYLRFEEGVKKFIRPPVFSRIDGREVRGGKGKLTDWGTRVPMIANWPGRIEPGQAVDDLVDFSDFLPTFAELAGAELPVGLELDGISFAGRLTQGEPGPRRWAYAESKGAANAFLRTRSRKLYSDGKYFDMLADPEEQKPLETEPDPDLAAALRKILGR